MKIKFICLLCLSAVINSLSARNENLLDDILSGKFASYATPKMTSTEDGEHYTYLTYNAKQIVKYSFKTGKEVDVLFDVDKARGCDFEKIDGYILSPAENKLLIYTEAEQKYRSLFKAFYWIYDIKRNLLEPLSENPGKQQCATFSPNGRMIVFGRDDNNLYLKKLDYGTEIAVTKDGKPGQIINGTPDWLYNEEFGVLKAFDWSPDSQEIAFIRFDETKVDDYSILMYPNDKKDPYLLKYKYPRAGTENPDVSVHVYSVETKGIKKMDLPVDPEYIPRLVFTPDPTKLAIMTMGRSQNSMTMYYANPKSTVCRQIFRDENDTFIDSDNLNQYLFTPNHFIALSEKDGFCHVYLYTLNGVLIKQLTSGKFDVVKLYGFDTKTNTLYYQASEESPLRREIYAVNEKGKKNKLSLSKGLNEAFFSKKCNYFVQYHSTLNSPVTVSLHESSGKQLSVLESNEQLKSRLKSSSIPQKELMEIPSEQGNFNAWILKPADFSPAKKYPVLLIQYNGPGFQKVLDGYEFHWEYYLASQGYIVVCADGVGTDGRGAAFRKASYLNLGIKESDSQIAVAKYLTTLSYVDKTRIGIWGRSFGGYNALMSMSRGNGIFKVGIAVAPVTDWRLYNTIYTERYMRTPNENFDGYMHTSAIELADQLQGKVLLVHGTADDNVHVQHTFDYIKRLIELDKDFDTEIIPDQGHRLNGEKTDLRLYKKMSEFIFNNL